MPRIAQLDKHQTGMAEVPSSILTGGNTLMLIFLFLHSKAIDGIIANFVLFVKTPNLFHSPKSKSTETYPKGSIPLKLGALNSHPKVIFPAQQYMEQFLEQLVH